MVLITNMEINFLLLLYTNSSIDNKNYYNIRLAKQLVKKGLLKIKKNGNSNEYQLTIDGVLFCGILYNIRLLTKHEIKNHGENNTDQN